MIQLLLSKGASVDATSPSGATSLCMAGFHGHAQTVEILLAAGANPNPLSPSGARSCQIPLILAAHHNHHIVVTQLLSAGAFINIIDDKHRTPLYAATVNDHFETMAKLLAAGADPNIGCFGVTPLHLAADSGNKPAISLYP